MIAWLQQNWGPLLVLAVVVAIVVTIIVSIVVARKKGKSPCETCGGCSGCAYRESCHKKEKQ